MRRLISSAFLAASVMLVPGISQAKVGAANAAVKGPAAAPAAPTKPKSVKEAYGKGITIPLSEDGKRFARMITWHQVWARVIQYNDNTKVGGVDPGAAGFDIGLRRSRFLLFGKITDRLLIVTHFGLNNQHFRAFKPRFYMHDAWVDYGIAPKYFHIGAGLHYWNGLSRMSNASTLNFLGLDAPIINWPYIERLDQFARQLGIFIKGKIGGFDYRFSLNKPVLNTAATLDRTKNATLPGQKSTFNPAGNSLSINGYVNWQFLDKESNTLPYMVGTYLGGKRVFNIGAGFVFHPNAMAYWATDDEPGVDTGDDEETDDAVDAESPFMQEAQVTSTQRDMQQYHMLLFAADVFADIPFGKDAKGGALTAYAVYYYYDMGPDHLRVGGLMNYADAGPTGNAYPLLGSGNHIYLQAGYLMPFKMGLSQLQLYFTTQVSMFDAMDDVSSVIGAGFNWYLLGHHAKITAHYRSRPQVDPANAKLIKDRKSELIIQSQIFF